MRDDISKTLGLNVSYDSDRELIFRYIYALKDLRKAIAHNAVVCDTRFRSFDTRPATKQCLKQEIGLPYVNFKTIGDYVLLMVYYLKLLHVPKTEIRMFIRDFEKVTEQYKKSVNAAVALKVIHPDQSARMDAVKKCL